MKQRRSGRSKAQTQETNRQPEKPSGKKSEIETKRKTTKNKQGPQQNTKQSSILSR